MSVKTISDYGHSQALRLKASTYPFGDPMSTHNNYITAHMPVDSMLS